MLIEKRGKTHPPKHGLPSALIPFRAAALAALSLMGEKTCPSRLPKKGLPDTKIGKPSHPLDPRVRGLAWMSPPHRTQQKASPYLKLCRKHVIALNAGLMSSASCRLWCFV